MHRRGTHRRVGGTKYRTNRPRTAGGRWAGKGGRGGSGGKGGKWGKLVHLLTLPPLPSQQRHRPRQDDHREAEPLDRIGEMGAVAQLRGGPADQARRWRAVEG